MNGLINAMKSIIRKLRFTKSQHDKPYFLSIVAVFKNEAMGMEEWLNHYIMQGVEHFYLIDNGSTDGTAAIAESYNVDHIIKSPKNQGLAKSFIIGLDNCLQLKADVIVNLDADNQYFAGDISKLTKPINHCV